MRPEAHPGNQYEYHCTSGAHTHKKINGMCVMISVPFEESVDIESREKKSFPLEFFLFKQVVSFPQC